MKVTKRTVKSTKIAPELLLRALLFLILQFDNLKSRIFSTATEL